MKRSKSSASEEDPKKCRELEIGLVFTAGI